MRRVLAFAAVAALTAVYAFLPMTAPGIDNSPDEAANRAFATEFAERGRLWREEPLDAVVPGMVHPRSVRVVDGMQTPVGFLGLPVLVGGVGRAVGAWAIPWVTPFVAAVAVLAWAGIAARLFGNARTGVLAGALLAVQPAWWYVASRTLMPNTLFLSLLIIAAWFVVSAGNAPSRANAAATAAQHAGHVRRLLAVHGRDILAGLALGFALAVRPAEAPWIALGVGTLLLAMGERAAWKRAVVVALAAFVALVPFAIAQYGLYGSALATGYGDALGAEVEGAATGGMAAQLLGPLRPILFPLGFAPRIAAASFGTYGIAFFGWWSALVGMAVAVWCAAAVRRRAAVTRRNTALAAAVALAALWLVLFYGSWIIQDNPDPNAVTIGTSYIRYWLPIFAVSTLPVAWLLHFAVAAFRPRVAAAVLVALLALTTAASARQVFASPEEGLLPMHANLARYTEERDAVLAATEADALIVVDRSDKLLYPHRAVVYPLRSERTYEALPLFAAQVPTYYLGITLPQTDIDWLNAEKLPPLGLSIETVLLLSDQTLYRFIMTNGL